MGKWTIGVLFVYSFISAFAGVKITSVATVISIKKGGEVHLAWDASTLNEDGSPGVVKGYKIRYGLAQGNYTSTVSESIIGTATNYKISGLSSGKTYYFVVTAIDSAGIESSYSNEFIHTIQ